MLTPDVCRDPGRSATPPPGGSAGGHAGRSSGPTAGRARWAGAPGPATGPGAGVVSDRQDLSRGSVSQSQGGTQCPSSSGWTGTDDHARRLCDRRDRGGPLAGNSSRTRPPASPSSSSALARFGPPASRPVALERPSGLVVDTLLEAGFLVVPIHPNVVKASGPRYTAAGGKSDPGDAYLLADLLRTDGHRFRPLQPLARRNPRPPRSRARPRRPRRAARGRGQSATRPPRALLARGGGDLRRRGLPDRPGLPHPLPHPRQCRAPRRASPRPVPPVATPTPAGGPRPSCWPACAEPPLSRTGDAETEASGELVQGPRRSPDAARRPDPATLRGGRGRRG